MARRLYLVVILLLIASPLASLPAEAAKRVALVIGNSSYKHASALDNPRNDAEDVSKAFGKLGFKVVKGLDLDKRSMEGVLQRFAGELEQADVGVFFYAGHGLQISGRNYMVPVDAKLSNAYSVDFELIRLDIVHRTMERATNTNILFLDACRDNPLARNLARAMGTRSSAIGRGLATMEAGVGTLISFSTQPGNVALDGVGQRNSPYARALVRQLAKPQDDISGMLIKVRRDVMRATKRKQVPWEHSALTNEFYLAPRKKQAIPPKPPATPSIPAMPSYQQQAELAFWNTVKDSDNPAILRTYLQQYPNGSFSALARVLIATLEKKR